MYEWKYKINHRSGSCVTVLVRKLSPRKKQVPCRQSGRFSITVSWHPFFVQVHYKWTHIFFLSVSTSSMFCKIMVGTCQPVYPSDLQGKGDVSPLGRCRGTKGKTEIERVDAADYCEVINLVSIRKHFCISPIIFMTPRQFCNYFYYSYIIQLYCVSHNVKALKRTTARDWIICI